MAMAFDESRHPRVPAGQPNGGQFAPGAFVDTITSGQAKVLGHLPGGWTAVDTAEGWTRKVPTGNLKGSTEAAFRTEQSRHAATRAYSAEQSRITPGTAGRAAMMGDKAAQAYISSAEAHVAQAKASSRASVLSELASSSGGLNRMSKAEVGRRREAKAKLTIHAKAASRR